MALDGIILYKCFERASLSLKENEKIINDLNVFPVPDGDTGSNMYRTLADALSREVCTVSAGECAQTLSSGMLRSARGNSGAILSQFFHGFARGLSGLEKADNADLARALKLGTEAAYGAVMSPCEGTVLTLMSRTAETADKQTSDESDFFAGLFSAARSALWETWEMLPVLKEANVVDAGGLGFLAILGGFCTEICPGFSLDLSEFATVSSREIFSAYESESFTFSNCVECFVIKSPEFSGEKKCSRLYGEISPLGDSIVFADTAEHLKLHIHTDSPETVFTLAAKYGTLAQTKVEDMALQHTRLIAPETEAVSPSEKEYGFVFVSSGEGFEAVFSDLGADRIVSGGQTMNPSSGEILSAVELTPAENVFVFPGNKNIILAARQAAELSGIRKVTVIPTLSLPQSIVARLAFDSELSPEENAEAMTLAAESIRTVSVTKAVRDAVVNGISVECGEYIGLLEGDLVSTGATLSDCLSAMEDIFSDAEFINLYYGADVDYKTAKETAGIISSLAPDGETELISGGQPLYDYLISLE